METVKFKGESNWDAIVNHNSLDIEEEREFEQFVIEEGFSKQSELITLETLYKQFTTLDAEIIE